ncbi:2OG-Fe(II) oxygenase [Propylenella binzhouense]|uniref:2OG-Fe(II) oxygenase n=1 Tax=Propylenella binzhouense TaxID=2555902 RepID=A0A964T217_9HYPH|nr:2OG-Fe(II) oxygenase [Propylenella binzhouense]MYZ47021.1 2OG-Fe(II) oxygenase [Propylenella binzhouense]
MQTVDLSAIREADLSHEPYDFLLGSDFLRREAIAELREDFPNLTKPGYLTVGEADVGGLFRRFIDELEGPELTEELSRRFDLDLHPFPRITTIMRRSQPRYGAIHTDGPSKVMTMLVYMNDAWSADESGRLRVLRDSKSFDDYVIEVPPTMGTVFAFLRSDKSWHGHKPFSGERRVVQVAWVRSAEDLERKQRRNRLAQVLKGVFGR